MNLFGLTTNLSLGRKQYALVIIDNLHRHCLLTHKDDTFHTFVKFKMSKTLGLLV